MDEEIEVNMPFKRIPRCGCDTGEGEPPTRLQVLECKLRGGLCSKVFTGEECDDRQQMDK